MEKKMNAQFLILWIGICIFFMLNAYFRGADNDRTIERIDQLEELIIERNYTDSLYHEHMSKCSYILNDEVTVGYGGVLYSNYHLKYAQK